MFTATSSPLSIALIEECIAPLRKRLATHPLYEHIRVADILRHERIALGKAADAAETALSARVALWDAIDAEISAV